MRLLHLLIADLFPPADFLDRHASGARAPALDALLARGRTRPEGEAGLADVLGSLFGLSPGQGAAPYRLVAEAGEEEAGPPARGGWMCLDPVHLRFHQDQLYLTGLDACPLEQAEADALVASLNDHFSADGWHCHAPHPQRWYLGLSRLPVLVTCPLDLAAGRRVGPRLPRGADATVWRRLLTEAQMLLHEHPVNTRREEAGLPAVNSVWPWGAGEWQPLPAGPWQGVLADLPLARGLASAAGLPCLVPPGNFREASLAHGAWLRVDDRLSRALWNGDAEAWVAGLARLEADWLRPALGALRMGRLDRLVVHGTGESALRVELTPLETWRFWRRR